jgi:hypothetical protein
MSDDEVTRTADAELVAAVRAEAMRHGDDPPLDPDAEPHFAEPPSDTSVDRLAYDVTVSRSDVLASIRAAAAEVRAESPAPPPPPPIPVEPRPVGRWSPPPRLKPAETPRAAPILADTSVRTGRRGLAMVIVAVVVAVGIGAFLIGRGGNERSPGDDTVPSTTVVGAPAAPGTTGGPTP